MKKQFEKVYSVILDHEEDKFEFYSEKNELLFTVEKSRILELLPSIDLYCAFQDKNLESKLIELYEYHISLKDKDIFGDAGFFENRILSILQNTHTISFAKISEISLFGYKEQVYIYLPAEDVPLLLTENLTNACCEFMEALGYELEHENEPIYGSFLQNMWFQIKRGTIVTKEEIAEDFSKGKKALELKYVELPTAEQTEKLANSALKIVECIKDKEEAVVRLGALLVLKKNVNGKSVLIIQQMNFDLISILDKSPQLLQNLQTIYELLTGDVKGIKDINETGQLKA